MIRKILNFLFILLVLIASFYFLGECYMKLNQVYEAKKYLKRSIELTKNELPYIALAKLCLFENHVTEAQNAYTTALKYYIFIFYFNIFYDERFILFHKHLARADLILQRCEIIVSNVLVYDVILRSIMFYFLLQILTIDFRLKKCKINKNDAR